MKMLEICLKLVGCKSKKGLSSSSSCYLEGEWKFVALGGLFGYCFWLCCFGGGGQSAGRQPGRCHSGTGVKDELLVTVTAQRQFARCGNGRMGEWKGEKVQGRESGRERGRQARLAGSARRKELKKRKRDGRENTRKSDSWPRPTWLLFMSGGAQSLPRSRPPILLTPHPLPPSLHVLFQLRQ